MGYRNAALALLALMRCPASIVAQHTTRLEIMFTNGVVGTIPINNTHDFEGLAKSFVDKHGISDGMGCDSRKCLVGVFAAEIRHQLHGCSEPNLPPLHYCTLRARVLSIQSRVLAMFSVATGAPVSSFESHPLLQGCKRPPGLNVGYSIEPGDIELFVALSTVVSARRIFVIGNAWGFSTIVLGDIFGPGVSIDAIDAETSGADSMQGSVLTWMVAAESRLDVNVHKGFSPRDVPAAMRSAHEGYDVIFIDGLHTNEQIVLDFIAVEATLSLAGVVVFHDIEPAQMQYGIGDILCRHADYRYFTYKGRSVETGVGTGVLWRAGASPGLDAAFALWHEHGLTRRGQARACGDEVARSKGG